MTFDAKQLKAAVETVRLPQDMGERLLAGCRAGTETQGPATRGAKGGRFPFRKALLAGVAACVTLCAVVLSGIGLRQKLWDTSVGEVREPNGEGSPQDGTSATYGGMGMPDEAGGGDTAGEEGTPLFRIDLWSMGELEEMREMAVCTDEDLLQAYLQRKGAKSREDLTAFLELLDSLPYPSFLEGEVIWIGYDSGLTFDSREPYMPNANLFITTEAKNGDWVRLLYLFPVGETPMTTGDGRVTLQNEKRERHPTFPGTLIVWDIEIDGLPVRAEFYTQDPDSVVTETLFAQLEVHRLGDLS